MIMPYNEYGTGKPIFLLHAFPLSGEMWEQQIDVLINVGFHVIIPDFRGFGKNICIADKHLMEDFAEDLERLFDQMNLKEAIICGLSMGGYVALNFFRLYSERVSALILCDTTYEDDSNEKKNTRFKLIKQIGSTGSKVLLDEMLPNLLSQQTKENNLKLVEQLTNTILQTDPKSAIAALRGMAERKNHEKVLAQIKIPTLLIFGETDKVTNIQTAKFMEFKIIGSKLRIISDAGHYSNLENPIEFNEVLLSFICKL